MSLNSSYLDAFYTCAQLRHFTRAAERLNITQSALSQRVKNLEEELNTTLIVRDRSGLRLTEQGEELLRYCQTKASIEEQFMGRLRGGSASELSGVVRIGGFSSVMRSVILPVLRDFLLANPQVRLRLVTKEVYELRSLLKSGEIDFLVIYQDMAQDHLETRHLGEEVNVLVQKKNYRGEDIYLDHDEFDQMTLRYLRKRSAEKIQRQYLDDVYGIVDGVKMGLGRAVIPKHLALNEKGLEILQPEKALKVKTVLQFYPQPIYSQLHQQVVDLLVDRSSDYLGGKS